MKVSQLIKSLGAEYSYSGADDFEVGGVSCNSRSAGRDQVFVAVRGAVCDGAQFIPEALTNGVRVVVMQPPKPAYPSGGAQEAVFVEVEDSRRALARLSAAFYGWPARELTMIGITGTNGKTTVSYLVEHFCRSAGKECAVIGTVNYRVKDTVIPAKNTTPGPVEMQRFLRQSREAGASHAVMEVSSHALDQGRVEEMDFGVAVFTNLTQDHLDYHKSTEEYFQAKAKLFAGLAPGACAVINADDPYGQRLENLTRAKVVRYGIRAAQAQVRASGIRYTLQGSEFTLCTPEGCAEIFSPLIGAYNVYNVLAAAATGVQLGFSLPEISRALRTFSQVPGRLEKVTREEPFSVFVDYAHTEDALANVIRSLRDVSSGRILVLFGCGGDRDKDKRPKMGRVVTEDADYAVITSDNPRSEDPAEIIAQIRSGIRKENHCVVPDREEAICRIISLARPGDVVLLAGKGHEQYQVLRERTVFFDDREVAKKCLRSRNS